MLEYLTIVVIAQITLLVVYKLTLTLMKHAVHKRPQRGKKLRIYQRAM